MLKCPKCGKEVSELDEKCKNCGIKFEDYEKERPKINNETNSETYTQKYSLFIIALLIIILIAGIIAGQEESVMMWYVWGAGIIFVVIVNMIRCILDELRRLNAKIK